MIIINNLKQLTELKATDGNSCHKHKFSSSSLIPSQHSYERFEHENLNVHSKQLFGYVFELTFLTQKENFLHTPAPCLRSRDGGRVTWKLISTEIHSTWRDLWNMLDQDGGSQGRTQWTECTEGWRLGLSNTWSCLSQEGDTDRGREHPNPTIDPV